MRLLLGAALLGAPGSATADTTGALSVYHNGYDSHLLATNATVFAVYSLQSTLGFVQNIAAPGTSLLNDCSNGGDDLFLSLSASCEGQKLQAPDGYVYDSPPSGQASTLIYRCNTGTSHFASGSSTCPGATDEGPLGYLTDSAPLIWYGENFVPAVTTGPPPSGFTPIQTLGYLVGSGPGRMPLYDCQSKQSQFVSIDAACGGQTLQGVEGWVYTSPPAGIASSALYDCTSGQTHFADDTSTCNGQTLAGLLGYVLNAPLAPPAVAPATSAPVSAPALVPTPASPGSRSHLRTLRVRLTLAWSWDRARHTWLRSVSYSKVPRGTRLTIACAGRGCPRHTLRAAVSALRRVHRRSAATTYRAGDRLRLTVSATGYAPIVSTLLVRSRGVPAAVRST